MTSSTINSDRLNTGAPNCFRRYATLYIGGGALLYVFLLVFSTTIHLIGTDVLPLTHWRRLGSGPMMLQHRLTMLQNDRYALVFGTSRNAMLSAEYLHEPTLNLNYVYGNPGEIRRCLNKLDEKQLRNITKVYVLLDYHTLDRSLFHHDLSVSLPTYLKDSFVGFSFPVAYNAFLTLALNLGAPNSYYVSEYGNIVRAQETVSSQILLPEWLNRDFKLDAIDDLQNLGRFLANHGIQGVFYTPTLPIELIQALGPDYIERYVRALSEALPEFYLLLYVQNISTQPRLFSDDSHLNQSGYQHLYLGTGWQQYLTTPANLDARLKELSSLFTPKP